MPQMLDQRRSTPSRLLGPPGPDDDVLLSMLRSAIRVPDHGKLAPWRFLLIRGGARERLGELLATRLGERDPHASTLMLKKERERFSFAPCIVAVIGRIIPGDRIPEQEQLLSCGCVCFSLLIAAQSQGFGAQWLTGWGAYDEVIASRLRLGEHERVIGFIHIGTTHESVPERERPDAASRLSEWLG